MRYIDEYENAAKKIQVKCRKRQKNKERYIDKSENAAKKIQEKYRKRQKKKKKNQENKRELSMGNEHENQTQIFV